MADKIDGVLTVGLLKKYIEEKGVSDDCPIAILAKNGNQNTGTKLLDVIGSGLVRQRGTCEEHNEWSQTFFCLGFDINDFLDQ